MITTDKVNVENGADFTFVCRKIPFAISCSELLQGETNLIDLDLVNSMKIPLRNIRVTRMSILGHDVRAVGRIKQTVQCVVKGKVQGCVQLEGKVVRNLFATFNVDCFASAKTYERQRWFSKRDTWKRRGESECSEREDSIRKVEWRRYRYITYLLFLWNDINLSNWYVCHLYYAIQQLK